MNAKWKVYFSIFFWISVISLLPGNRGCTSRELEAYTSGSLTYRSYGYIHYSKGKHGGYDKNQNCEILFKASYRKDVIKIEVVDNDMQEKSFGRCIDRVTLYNGPSSSSPVLKVFCGKEKPVIESTSDKVLMIFQTDNHDSRNYRGFKLEYSSIDRGGFDAYKESNASTSTGTIIASVIPSIIVYTIIMVVVYKRCKYAQRVRRNLAATGHTPDDIRVAMATMLDQASRGQLNVSRPGPEGIQQGLIDLMDQNSASRNGMASNGRAGGDGRAHRGRVRHPAGDVRTNGNISQNNIASLHDSEATTAFLSYDSSDQVSGYYSQPSNNNIISNNNITTNNNTAANLNYQAYPSYPPDPTGIYYAGDVDEHGMLHPADGSPAYYPSHGSIPTSVPNPVFVNIPHLDIEDDRRSRSSGRRSPHSIGRNSPRAGHSPNHSHSGHRSRTGSAGQRSAHSSHRHARGHHNSLNQLDMEGSTLTYYGMLDGTGSDSGDLRPETEITDTRLNESANTDVLSQEEFLPPPSYEEAATGKYSPKPTS